MPLPIGAMRHRLVLQTPAETPDLAGGVVRGWSTVATLWAAIEPLSGTPEVVGAAPTSLARLRVVLP
jgi:head-tail adaptor